MRILPGLTASPAAARVKKGTYPVSARILPIAGPVFTPLKAPTRTIANPILTGPFISTQERSAATKNVLTSVTQKPAIGPLVLPKPYVAPKPVQKTIQLPTSYVTTQQKAQTAAAVQQTVANQNKVGPLAYTFPKPTPKTVITTTTKAPPFWSNEAKEKRAAEAQRSFATGLDYFNRYTETALSTVGAIADTYAGYAWNKDTWDIAKERIRNNFSQIWSPPALEEAGVPAAIGRAAGNALSLAGTIITTYTLGKALVDFEQQLALNARRVAYYGKLAGQNPEEAAPGIGAGGPAPKVASERSFAFTPDEMRQGVTSAMSRYGMTRQEATDLANMFQEIAKTPYDNTGALSYASNAKEPGFAVGSAAFSPTAPVTAPTVPELPAGQGDILGFVIQFPDIAVKTGVVASASAASQLTTLTTQVMAGQAAVTNLQAAMTASIPNLGVLAHYADLTRQPINEVMAEQARLAVPVGQPVTTQQTVAPAPVRTAIPAQATAPVSRILPYAAEAPAVSSPVATISTRQLPIAPSTTPTTQPVATATAQPWELTSEQRQSKIAALQVQYKRELATPLMSEGNISPMQVGQMSKNQLDRFQQDGQTKFVIEAQIQDLEHPELAKVRFDQNVVAKNQEQITALQSRLGVLQQFGQRKNGMMRPSYQKEIDKVQAQLDTLVAPVTAPLQISPSAAISTPETSVAPSAPATTPVVAPAAKQPWEMTQTEYAMNMWESELQTFRNRPDILDGKDKATEITHFRELHAGEVARAIAAGKPVPANVLTAYPDLKATTPAVITPIAQNEPQPLDIEDKNIDDLVEETMDTPTRLAGTKVQIEGSKVAGEKNNGNPDHDGYLATIVEVGKNGSTVSVTREGSDKTFVVSEDRLTQLSRIVDTGRVLWDDVTSTPTEPAPSETLQANDEVPFKQGVVQKTPAAVMQPERRTVAPGFRETVDQQIDRAYKEKDPQAIKRLLEEVRNEGRTDPLTGLKNSVAWEAADKTDKIVASTDLTGLHWANNKFGHDFGDLFLKLTAQAMRSEGIDAYRKGGDEFAALFDTQAEADTMMGRVQQTLEQTPIMSTVNGVPTTWIGWRLDYGTGEDFQSADAALLATRAELEQQGLRSTRAGQPVGITQVSAGGSQTDHLVALVHQHEGKEPAAEVKRTQDKLTPWVGEGRQPTPRELLNSVVGMGYTLSESSRQMFDTKELNKLPMLQKLFRKSGTKVIGLDDLASRLFSEYSIDRPQGDLQADDWLAQQLVAGASKGAGNATTDLFGSPIRTRAVAPKEAQDTELFGKGQKAAFNTQQINAAERGRHLQGQNQRTEQVRQAPADEGILAGEVADLGFNVSNGNLGTNANVTGTQANQPTTAGYEMNVTPSTGTTARTIAAENLQKVVLAVKDYVTTLASHPKMKESDYHAQLQDRLKQLGVPAGLFTPTQILSMYQASKGPSQLWNLTNRVLMKLNAYNAAQMDLAGALNTIPSSVLTKGQKRTLQDATLDNADLMRSLDFIDHELTKAQVTADLREKFDDMLTAEKEKAAIRLAKMAHRVDAAKLQAEEKAAAKDAALKDKATRDKAVTQINRSLTAVKNNVESGHTIALANVDNIRAMTQGSVTSNKLTTAAIHARTTDQLEHLAGAIKTQIALGRLARMQDVAVRKQVIADTVAERLPHIRTMSGYQEKTFDDKTYRAVESRLGAIRNWAAELGLGLTPTLTVLRNNGMEPFHTDMSQALDGAIIARDVWDKEGLDEAIADGVATDLQQRRIGIWLINQTSGGRNHLLHTGVPGHMLTEQQIDDVQLTPEEEKFAKAWLAHADTNFPILRDFFRDFHNIEITKVDMYTTLLNSSEFQPGFDKGMRDLTFQGAMTGLRHTPKVGEAITRTGGNNAVETNIMRIWRSYDETLAYAVNFAPPLAKWWGVLQNEDVMNKLGPLGNLYMRTMITNLTYRGGPGGHAAASGLDRVLDWLRRNLSRGQILFRPTSALVHFMQIANVAGVTGPSYVMEATGLLVSDKKYGEWVYENFPRLRDSVRNYFEILGIEEDKPAKVGGFMFKWCHNAARVTGAVANYMWLCQKNGITLDWEHPDQDTVTEAMNLVNQEFGSEDIVAGPLSLETGIGFGDDKSLARLFVQFQQDVLAKFDLIKTQLGTGWEEGDAKKLAQSLFWLVLVATGLVAGVRYGYKKLVSAVTGKKGVISGTYFEQYLADLAENLPFGNWLMGMLQYGDVPIPVLSTLVDTPVQISNAWKFKSGYAKLRATIRAATDLGSLGGVVGIGTFGQIVTGIIPTTNGTSTGTTTTAKPSKPTKPAIAKPHK